jgi:hypothetical protein
LEKEEAMAMVLVKGWQWRPGGGVDDGRGAEAVLELPVAVIAPSRSD